MQVKMEVKDRVAIEETALARNTKNARLQPNNLIDLIRKDKCAENQIDIL